MKKTLQGMIERISFYSPDSNWGVFQVATEEGKTTVVGILNSPQEGGTYNFEGVWKDHSQYGPQFKFSDYAVIIPEDKNGAIRYLSSTCSGVGEVRAKRIVDDLGDDAIQQIQKDPNVLYRFPFIKEEQVEEIRTDLQDNQLLAEFKVMICRKGITPYMANKIWGHFSNEDWEPQKIMEGVKENPYIITEVERVGFLLADRLAGVLGVAKDSPFRVEAAIEYVLKEATGSGHVYLPVMLLIRKVRELLKVEISNQEVGLLIKKMIEDRSKLEREGNNVYLKTMYEDEVLLARYILDVIEGGVQCTTHNSKSGL